MKTFPSLIVFVFLVGLALPKVSLAQNCLIFYMDCEACGGSISRKQCCVPSGCLLNEVGNGSCTNSGKCIYTCNGQKYPYYYYCPASPASAEAPRTRVGAPLAKQCLPEESLMLRKPHARGTYSVSTLATITPVSLAYAAPPPLGAQQDLQPVAVHVNVPRGAPLKITDLQAMPIPDGYAGVQCKVTNTGTVRLVAVEITWKLTYANGQAERALERADFFFDAHGALAPGASSRPLTLGKSTSATTGPLTQASGSVTFAEFADGTEYGSNATEASRSFADDWMKCMQYYREALAAYQSNGITGLDQAMNWRAQPAEGDGRSAWINLHQIEEQQGMPGVVDELTRISKLRLPGQ